MRDKLLLLAALLSGCAATPLAVRPTGGTTIEIANVTDGGNCVSTGGGDGNQGAICALRLHSNLEHILGKKLGTLLPAGGSYHARLEITGGEFDSSERNRILERSVSYHFTLSDSGGHALVDVTDRLAEPVPTIDHGMNLPAPDEMRAYPDLYQPPVLYQMLFDMVDRIGQSIANSHTAQARVTDAGGAR